MLVYRTVSQRGQPIHPSLFWSVAGLPNQLEEPVKPQIEAGVTPQKFGRWGEFSDPNWKLP